MSKKIGVFMTAAVRLSDFINTVNTEVKGFNSNLRKNSSIQDLLHEGEALSEKRESLVLYRAKVVPKVSNLSLLNVVRRDASNNLKKIDRALSSIEKVNESFIRYQEKYLVKVQRKLDQLVKKLNKPNVNFTQLEKHFFIPLTDSLREISDNKSLFREGVAKNAAVFDDVFVRFHNASEALRSYNPTNLELFKNLDTWVKKAPLNQKRDAREVKNRVVQFVLGEENVLKLQGLRFNKGTLFDLFRDSAIPKLSSFEELDVAPLKDWINRAPKNTRQPRIEAANTVLGLVLYEEEKKEVNALEQEAFHILENANRNYSGIGSVQMRDSRPAVSEARSTSVGGPGSVRGSSGVSREEGGVVDLIPLYCALDAWVKGAPQGQEGEYNKVKNKLIDAVLGLSFNQTYRNNTVVIKNKGLTSLPDIFQLDILGVKRLNRLIIKGNPIMNLPDFPENLTVETDITQVGVGQKPSAISCGGGSSPRESSASDQQEAGSPNTVTEVPGRSGQGLGLSQDLSNKSSSRSRSSSLDLYHLSPL